MIDTGHAVIVDVEATPARTYDEVAATRTMIDRTEKAFGLTPKRLTADTAYGTGKLGSWTGTLRRIFPCGRDTNGLMACSLAPTSLMTP